MANEAVYCPNCRGEFREGLTRCPECGVQLVAELPLAPTEELEWQDTAVVYETNDPSAMLRHKWKIIQLSPVFQAAPTVTLAALRDVIGALDEHLVACLKTAAPRIPSGEWRAGVVDGIHSEMLPKQVLGELADALAGVRRVQSSG